MAAEQFPAFPLPEHISYSAISGDCGERTRLERVYRVPQPPSWALVGGSAFHSATEIIDVFNQRADARLERVEKYVSANSLAHNVPAVMDAAGTADKAGEWDCAALESLGLAMLGAHVEREREAAPEAFKDCSTWRATGRATKANPNKEDGDWWEKNMPTLLAGWDTWSKTSGFTLAQFEDDTPAIEVKLSIALEYAGESFEVMGFIDRMMLNPGGQAVIVDIKSGSREPQSAEQLGIYSVGVEQLGFPKPVHGYYWMARKGEAGVMHDMTRYTEEYFAFAYGAKKQWRDKGIFLPNTGSPFCPSCTVKDYCWAKNGELSHLIPRPWEAGPLTIQPKEGK